MWMGRQLSRRAREDEADTGTVTAAGAILCAVTDGEKRNLTVFAPGGYRWQPAAGQQVLVLKNGAVCGVRPEAKTPLEPGEVEICGPDGAMIRLQKDGRIAIVGDVELTGELTVTGSITCDALTVGGREI